MTREQRELRRHLRNPDLRKWIQKNEAWFTSNPSALHSLLNRPELLNAMQTQVETRKNRVNRRLAKAERRTAAVHQSQVNGAVAQARKRKPIFRLPKLSLSNLNMDTATDRLAKAAEVMDTIRNLSGLFGR